MTVINFDEIIGKGNNYITDNILCISHPTNCLITGKSNSGKAIILMNLIAQKCIYDKIHIFTNNSNDDKYIWLFTFILMKLILIKLIKIKLIWSYLMISFFHIRKYQHFLHKVEN